MARYKDVHPLIRQMLINIEAETPSAAQAYLDHFGLTELPVPLKTDNDERQFRTWQLQPIRVGEGIIGYDYVKSHVPADKGGYIQAMTGLERFDAERPTDVFDVEGNLVEPKPNKSSKRSSE